MLLTVAEVAERLRVSASLVYALIGDGTMPCRRIGQKGRRGCVRISEDDLGAYLEGTKAGGKR